MTNKDDEYADLGVELGKSRKRRFSLRRLRTFESFKIPAFRLYYGAMAGQWFAQSTQILARSLLVYRITGSGADIGIISIAHAVPTVLVSLLGGAIADRIEKKYLLLIGQAGSAVLAFGIAIALNIGYLSQDNPGSTWVLVVTAVIQGSLMGFMMPARMAVLPEIVGEERVMNAISLSTMGQRFFQFIGPALGGLLIAAYDFVAIYYLMTGMFLLACIFALFLPRTGTSTAGMGNPFRNVVEGFGYMKRDKTVLLLMVFGLCHMLVGMPFQQLLVIFTEDVLMVGADQLGIMMGALGVGALLTAVTLASLPNQKRGLILLLSGVIMGSALIVFSWSQWWYLSLCIIPIIGMGPTTHTTLTSTLVQYYVEPSYRGRMQSFVMMGMGLASFGTFMAGVMSDSIGIQWTIGVMAIFIIVVAILFLTSAPKLRHLE